MEDAKTLSLVVLGSVAVVAVLGLVMLFNSDSISGAALYAGRERADISMDTSARAPIGECLRVDAETGEFTNVEPIHTCYQWETEYTKYALGECRLFKGVKC